MGQQMTQALQKNQESKAAGDVKIGVLVQDVSGEEALGFRAYYEDYVADQYGVTFTYTDELKDAASEKSAIEKFASQGYQAVISLSSNDRALQIETCEENQIYYAVAAGNIDDDQFEQYKSNECFLGQVGPSMQTEYEAGVDMGKFFADKGIKTAVIYGAFIPNPMHVYRVAGVLSGLGLAYDGSTEEDEVVGKLFANQGVDASKISGDIKIVSYLQGYGDTTTDELNAAIQAAPDAFISVGMATTFFTQQLNAAGIEFSDIDSFTKSNGEAISEGKLVYLAGKYSVLLISIAIFDYTKFGYDYNALKNGQKVAVNTGIKEIPNAIGCYVICGGLMGIVGFLNAARNTTINGGQLNFGSISIMFTAFLPMFIGSYISRFTNEKIGFFLAALCMSMLNSTFAVFSNEVNASMQAIINAVLLVVFLIYLSNEQLLVKIFTGKRKA